MIGAQVMSNIEASLSSESRIRLEFRPSNPPPVIYDFYLHFQCHERIQSKVHCKLTADHAGPVE